AAGVTSRRLNPEFLKRTFAQNSAIAYTIKCNPAGQTEIPCAGLLMYCARQSQHDFLGNVLHRPREIHFPLSQWALGLARWAIKQRVKLAVRHLEARTVAEILQIEPKRSIGFKIQELIVDCLHVLGASIGRKAHDLVLAGVHFKTRVVSKRGIKQSQRMREGDLPQRR